VKHGNPIEDHIADSHPTGKASLGNGQWRGRRLDWSRAADPGWE